ncbi:hypothetical protein QQG55_4025 [Brugia pahangi]
MRWASPQRRSSPFQKLPPLATVNEAVPVTQAVWLGRNNCSVHWSGTKYLTSSQQQVVLLLSFLFREY